MKSFLFLIPILFFCGCATNSSRPVLAPPLPQAQVETPQASQKINMQGLEKDLGLERSFESLGFQEKAFQTCSAGNGFSNHQNCQIKYFVVIHFQLMCRDSEGTISTILTIADLQPVSQQPVIWTLKNSSSSVQTDDRGYGQIRMISSIPQNQQRLKLSVGNDFLYTRAGEITRVATPPSWCAATSANR